MTATASVRIAGRVYLVGNATCRIQVTGLVSSGRGGSMRLSWVVVFVLSAAAARAQDSGRIHALRAARAGDGAVPDRLRSDGHDARRDRLLQSDPQGQRGERRGGPRPRERQAAAVRGGGRRASARAGRAEADLDTRYIKVELPRPRAAEGGEVRLRIEKTYKDAEELPQRRRARRVLALARHQAQRRGAARRLRARSACNVPAQVLQEPDGRIKVSFMNPGPDAAAVVVKGRRLP